MAIQWFNGKLLFHPTIAFHERCCCPTCQVCNVGTLPETITLRVPESASCPGASGDWVLSLVSVIIFSPTQCMAGYQSAVRGSYQANLSLWVSGVGVASIVADVYQIVYPIWRAGLWDRDVSIPDEVGIDCENLAGVLPTTGGSEHCPDFATLDAEIL